ncbi:MAG: pyridoxamine 5'-phosphate oxidase family protein [Gemmobacter sp.]
MWIETEAALAALYGTPGTAATVKVAPRLTASYRAWIARARFCILTTVGPEGTDGSPRGDDGPVVQIADDATLLLPDWRGNDRIDSLRNIVRDGRVSLLFLIPGSGNAMRVNGRARLSADPALTARFDRAGARPRCVIAIAIAEVYPQCARAVLRAGLWSGRNDAGGLPTVGEMLAEITRGGFDGAAYDADWPGRAARTMW